MSLRGSPDATYQVVNVDAFTDNVWVRRWPLRSDRSPTFAVPSEQVEPQLVEPELISSVRRRFPPVPCSWAACCAPPGPQPSQRC